MSFSDLSSSNGDVAVVVEDELASFVRDEMGVVEERSIVKLTSRSKFVSSFVVIDDVPNDSSCPVVVFGATFIKDKWLIF